MSMNEEQILEILKRACCDAFCEKIDEKESISEIKTFIQNINPVNVRAYILDKLNAKLTSLGNSIQKLTADVSDIEDLKEGL